MLTGFRQFLKYSIMLVAIFLHGLLEGFKEGECKAVLDNWELNFDMTFSASGRVREEYLKRVAEYNRRHNA
jgi:hypothetical protein